ncbi:hypothetical protein BDN71DRAFT_1506048 [Pleurotus eryngii]|uniref:Uncharacterized protein n=1 Tax=Pleurotus eryngii TaxID=5323 RepID=A0A9P6DH86_PLEER|nr:hypothetical protein BDN71DRAFT_1506048 [Pleurotus eryngii]
MASVNQKSHSRRRSASDPFTDQASPRRTAPTPPPKSSHKSYKMPAQATVKSAPANHETHREVPSRDAVVQVDGSSGRNKMGRSHTALTPTRDSPHRAIQSGRRSQSQDSAPAPPGAVEKAKSGGKRSTKKGGSQHADVIDRLDYTGVGLFHHDGPFDACAPSRNRQRNKAPMLAWSGRPEEAAPELAANNNSPYPAPEAYKAFATTNYYQEPPKKKVDAIAEAWGTHEPEPFEEFYAGGGRNETPASSIHNGREAHSSRSRRIKDTPRDGADDAAHNRSRPNRRSAMPPPQPIFVPDPATETEAPLDSPPTSAPKRSKSLMQRIRKMRDAPNVPVSGNDYRDEGSVPSSPTSPVMAESYPGGTRPTHRSHNSFLGRFGGKATQQQPNATAEPFVLVNNTNDNRQNKDLPQTPYGAPLAEPVAGYFDGSGSGVAGSPHSPMSAGMARKPSLMKKMRGVMRPSKRE